ncbi:MAG: transcriptional regulator [Candidatus Marinimicrobia bacterium]|nr:transcriptional regulator [Lentisphaeria bacterium]MCF7902095.1 transcriptional regulator [Candidatus Neomarinimicrobiota bacterium]
MSDPIVPQDMDKLIHEPARLAIMTQLYVVESADFIFVMQRTGLTWGNLSSHLAKLENAGYVSVEKQFVDKKPHTLLQLTPRGRTAFEAYRRQMEAMLASLPKS